MIKCTHWKGLQWLATREYILLFILHNLQEWIQDFFERVALGENIQYSSQVTSPAGTRECHNGAPREAPMLTFPAQDLRLTAWIIASHASIFSCQEGHCEDQPAPRLAEHSSLHSIVASHLRTIFINLGSRGSSYHIFQLPQAAILKSAWTSAWTDWVPTGLTVRYIA